MILTVTEIQAWLSDFTKMIEESKEYLSELDTPIGDGDHGNNMNRGVIEYKAAFETKKPTTISDTFKVLSMALISKVGGASGPLYGSAFMNLTKATKNIEEITSKEQLVTILETGLTGIQTRGKAEPGDKTMVDVWYTVIEKMKNTDLSKESILIAKEQTKQMQAKKGRASYLGERSIGHIDPGAASSALLFQSLLPYLEKD
ncbi:dihydroxyacetone kinase subunit DhaL [Enterococcus dongliensis]|uniref:phosphoenolpyruvate--glycerone phosphotransferase n=1 Tax=Enterococcus dongliensis TaxID=2559925 RepID=A0AAP5NNC0_9ENTE|nr:dihydroxyacetone kinase subunit DhaL [Enterococcus dongliensis]MDT2597526.1 dihydroxyacetone kinase subunit DhaL [Enterococcus dongliensis]MDT2604721.1 dihydroxyacetone kinase subunit DhaL [Enterococcus dongliensis]MDT2613662.1 dihydroxyacetone kinase subunit DhaL [Enterococcus dongliensis]MDT2635365.1 dihydroxyacetone kinase subunit DhaL [Enterococcus dongliensis]MDT2638249.1 dihydroxyacetone kinase subunit DhaL [Enterococcus dongliensis]